MARSAVVLNAKLAARLLRRQTLREQQARMELAVANAAQRRADTALESARQIHQAAAQSAEQEASSQWQETAGKLISAAALAALRENERALAEKVAEAEQRVRQARDNLTACGEVAREANTKVIVETLQTARRERFATIFRNRLLKHQARVEEIALEDDLLTTGPIMS